MSIHHIAVVRYFDIYVIKANCQIPPLITHTYFIVKTLSLPISFLRTRNNYLIFANAHPQRWLVMFLETWQQIGQILLKWLSNDLADVDLHYLLEMNQQLLSRLRVNNFMQRLQDVVKDTWQQTMSILIRKLLESSESILLSKSDHFVLNRPKAKQYTIYKCIGRCKSVDMWINIYKSDMVTGELAFFLLQFWLKKVKKF